MISPIKNVFLNINNTCPYQCEYCWVRKTKGEQLLEAKKKMTPEILKQTYIYFKNLQLKTLIQYPDNHLCIIFATKEPLLDFYNLIQPFILELDKSNEKYQIDFQILTNGLLLTEKIAKFCREYKIKILMSLDGNEESNNKNRKYYINNENFAFQKTLEGASYLLPEERCFTFTVNKNTIEYLYESLEFLSKYPHRWTRFNFNLFSELTQEDWEKIWSIFREFFKNHKISELQFLKLYRHPSTAIDEDRGIIMGVDYLGNISIKKPFHSSIPWIEKNNVLYRDQKLRRNCGNIFSPNNSVLTKWIEAHGPSYSHTNFKCIREEDCKNCFCFSICHPNTKYFSHTQYYWLSLDECKIRQTDFKITECWRDKYRKRI